MYASAATATSATRKTGQCSTRDLEGSRHCDQQWDGRTAAEDEGQFNVEEQRPRHQRQEDSNSSRCST